MPNGECVVLHPAFEHFEFEEDDDDEEILMSSAVPDVDVYGLITMKPREHPVALSTTRMACHRYSTLTQYGGYLNLATSKTSTMSLSLWYAPTGE